MLACAMRPVNDSGITSWLVRPFARLVILADLSATGCTGFEGKFASTQIADTSYFTDQTISMLSSARLQMDLHSTLYTKKFWPE